MWKQFDALGGVPVMVIRGENSDILSADDRRRHGARRPDLVAIEVPDQGHTPLLVEPRHHRPHRQFRRRLRAASGRPQGVADI